VHTHHYYNQQRRREELELDNDVEATITEKEILWRANFEKFVHHLRKKVCYLNNHNDTINFSFHFTNENHSVSELGKYIFNLWIIEVFLIVLYFIHAHVTFLTRQDFCWDMVYDLSQSVPVSLLCLFAFKLLLKLKVTRGFTSYAGPLFQEKGCHSGICEAIVSCPVILVICWVVLLVEKEN